MVAREQISIAIRQVRDHFVASGQAQSYWAINNGQCDDFAREVATALGGESDQIYGVSNGNFCRDGDDFAGDWDWKLLKTHWKIAPPMELTKKQAAAIEFGTHVWLTDGKLHYDAECPQGVSSFFDLPCFRRNVVQDLRERGIVCAEVATDDVTAEPQCPVENPEQVRPRLCV